MHCNWYLRSDYLRYISDECLNYRGCESETDTEEFEKVGQSPLELQFDCKNVAAISPRPGTHDAATLTEVGHMSSCCVPPRKPPRSFHKSSIEHTTRNHHPQPHSTTDTQPHSVQQSQSLAVLPVSPCIEHNLKLETHNNESCTTNDETDLASRIVGVGEETGFVGLKKSISLSSNHHHQSKGLNPELLSPCSPCSSQGHPQAIEFVTDEFYIDESMPSSLSIEGTTQSQGELSRQLDQANTVIALFQVHHSILCLSLSLSYLFFILSGILDVAYWYSWLTRFIYFHGVPFSVYYFI